jgi:hypothetical protein
MVYDGEIMYIDTNKMEWYYEICCYWYRD